MCGTTAMGEIVLSRFVFASAIFCFTALTAAFAGELHDAVRASDASAVQTLLSSGVDVDESDYIIGTPLIIAVSQGSGDLAKILIESGADVETRSEQQGARAAHLAASFGDATMLELLLDSGAEVNALDDSGRTPLHRAASSGDEAAITLLLERGADTEIRDVAKGRTALIQAALSGKTAAVKLLVDAGANLEARDSGGRTALRAAATAQSWSVLRSAELIVYLIEAGADINSKEDNGLTILGWANSARGEVDEKVIEVLKRHGAIE